MDIALTVGGSVLSALLGALFDRMDKPEFLNLFRKQNYDGSILEKLKWKLMILQAVLEDAENKQTKNAAVKMWLDQLQDVFYQADDLLDLINTEALRVQVESQYSTLTIKQVSDSKHPSNLMSVEFLKDIMPKLEKIVQKLEDFEQKISILGLVKEVEPKKQQFRHPSTSLVENDECGRDDDKNKIIQDLLSDDGNREHVTVISIVGLGGVGKTTLAKLVYNDERVNTQFDTKAWVCISEEYDAVRITKSILNELKVSCSDPNETFNSLQLKLKASLSKKKFFLLLDDIWNRKYEDWLALSAPFKDGNQGSKIIVTTRDEKIALMMGKSNRHIHHLNPMSEEDCWSLFKKHVLDNREDTGNLEFESTGKEIVKKCGGLPLAVKAIAGLLRSKETIEEWDEVLRSDEWDQSSNESGILPSLRLSYTHLSSLLKRCFGYCAVFHKDYQFTKDEIILLWMANDLLEIPQRNKRLEDVGDEFFRELRFRSLFQRTSAGKFCMHDLVNDLAKFVSGKYFLRLENDQKQNNSSIVVRHFSYSIGFLDTFDKFKPVEQTNFLRTFLPIDSYWRGRTCRSVSKKLLSDVLPTYGSLRVLSLSGYGITELPNSLSNLKQLRFFDLSYAWIKKLPSWICTFYNLQTLLLANCRYLKEFPEDMEKLVNLRHFDISGVPLTKMPLEIGRLKNIQFLSIFVVSKENCSRIEELGKLCNLHGDFTISGLENVTNGRNASMAKMKDKKFIQKLTLEWKGDAEDSQAVRDVLENLRPHTIIEHLEIKGYSGTRFADWLQDPSFWHLRNLHISGCKNCFHLPAIELLPSLKHLTISDLGRIVEMGQEIHGNTHLEELSIKNCPQLIGGIPKQLPFLRELVISGCPGLVNSEGELTIFDFESDFSSLSNLRIERMPNLKRLSSSQLDLNKLLPCLEELHMVSCAAMMSFNHLPTTTLKKVHISDCGSLELETNELTFGNSNGASVKKLSPCLFPSLQALYFWKMEELSFSIPQGNQNLTSLQCLCIQFCDNFVSFPVSGLLASNLTRLDLKLCPKLNSLPKRMCALLPSLQSLYIEHCPEIECFPEGGLPSSLKTLYIKGCEKLWSCHGQWGLQRLSSLTHLMLYGLHQQETWLPEDLQFPSTLASLYWGDNKNVKTLDVGVFQNLISLQSLYIRYCPKLQSLPEEELPSSLSELTIRKCPLLEPRLAWDKGEDWPKVAHIPIIAVNGEFIP